MTIKFNSHVNAWQCTVKHKKPTKSSLNNFIFVKSIWKFSTYWRSDTGIICSVQISVRTIWISVWASNCEDYHLIIKHERFFLDLKNWISKSYLRVMVFWQTWSIRSSKCLSLLGSWMGKTKDFFLFFPWVIFINSTLSILYHFSVWLPWDHLRHNID